MIRTISLRSWGYLWRFSFFRWSCSHGPVGVANYSVAFVLFWLYGVDKYIATIIGHATYVFFGFFYNRAVAFQKVLGGRFWTWIRYWITESLSYLSILVVIYILITVIEFSLCGFVVFKLDLCGPETVVAVVRAGPAMIVASLISSFGHKRWIFVQANSRSSVTWTSTVFSLYP
jgi:putative flippase GtrA